jgi:hypothetical protein
MADMINMIYEKSEDFQYLKENARDYIRNNFTWNIYEIKLLDVIEKVLNNSRRV